MCHINIKEQVVVRDSSVALYFQSCLIRSFALTIMILIKSCPVELEAVSQPTIPTGLEWV